MTDKIFASVYGSITGIGLAGIILLCQAARQVVGF